MTHGKKKNPCTPTKERPNIIHHIPPSRSRDDLKRKVDIHIDMFSPIKRSPTNVLKNFKKLKNIKIHNLLTYVSLVFIVYQIIYNLRVKGFKVLMSEVTGWRFTFPSLDPPNFSIRWEAHRKHIAAVSPTSCPDRQRTAILLLFVSNPTRRHRHLWTVLPVLLQTETSMNGAAGHCERLFQR